MIIIAVAYVALLYFNGINIDTIKYIILIPMLISAFVIDLRLQIIPNRLTLTIFEVGLVITFLTTLLNINGGIDLFIDAIGRIAHRNDIEREIIAFVMTPGWVDAPRTDLKERMASDGMFFTPLPDPIVTHRLHNYDNDNIISQIHYLGIDNRSNNPVKLIFIPSYLTGSDGILDMPYYDLLMGMDATAFPSYYEPWGYTPLESIAFGVPTVTTQLSGFGQWIISHAAHSIQDTGVEVLQRNGNNFADVSEQLASTLVSLSQMKKSAKTALDKAASKQAAEAEWKNFIVYYQQAYEMALKHCKERNQK